MKGLGSFNRVRAASMFVVAALSGAMARASERHMRALANIDPAQAHLVKGEASNGAFNYRGGPGTRAAQRAAQKRRNVARHRKACRG